MLATEYRPTPALIADCEQLISSGQAELVGRSYMTWRASSSKTAAAAGFSRRSSRRTVEVDPRTAVHEAGHCIAALAHGQTCSRVTALPDDGLLGFADLELSGCDPRAEAVIFLSGTVAERYYATVLKPYTIPSIQISDADAGKATAALARIPVHPFDVREPHRSSRLFEAALCSAQQLVATHWRDIEKLADELMKRGELSGDEVADLIGE